MYSDAQELREALIQQFPKLADGGGYELLRLSEMRNLEIISEPASGYSVEYLKSVSSAKIFIRPLQRNLDTDENVVS